MAAGRETIAINFQAELGDLKRQLATLPDVTKKEANAMVRELTVGLKAAERAAAKAAKASQKAMDAQAASMKGLRKATADVGSTAAVTSRQISMLGQSVAMQLPDVASQLASGTDPFIIAMQQGLQVVQVNMGLITTTLKALTSVLIYAAAPAVALGSAYLYAADEAERAAEEAGRLQARVDEAATAHDRARAAAAAQGQAELELAEFIKITAREIDVLTGALEAEEAARQSAIESIQAKNKQYILTASIAVEAAKREKQALFELRQNSNMTTEELAQNTKLQQNASENLFQAQKELRRRQEQVAKAEELATEKLFEKKSKRINDERVAVEEAERKKQEAQANTAQREAEAEAARQRRAAERENEKAIAELDKLLEAQQKAAESALSQAEQLEIAKRRQIAIAQAALAAGADEAAVTEAIFTAEMDFINEIAKLEEERAAAADAQHQKEMEQMREKMKEAREIQMNIVNATAQSFDALGQLAGTAAVAMAQAGTKQAKQSAMMLFGISKGLALASIPIKLAEALMTAQTLAPPISGLRTATALATAASQTVAVASAKPPTFDRGGIVNSGTGDQVMAAVLPGEAVLNRQATASLGRMGVNALNSGRAMGGTIVVEQRYGHRIFDRFIVDNIAAPTPLGDALRGSSVTGRR